MHVLHRPHLPRAITVTVTAALLAIVLTLAIATDLSDRGSAPAPATASGPATAGQASVTRPSQSEGPFTRSPFSSLLVTSPFVFEKGGTHGTDPLGADR
jgi:hypothetical protein